MPAAMIKNTKQELHPESCARCNSEMVEMHCKVMCTNCGYMRDCNDQW